MKSRLFPVVIILLIFAVGLGIGRFLILPVLRGHTGTVTVQRVGTPADQRLATANPLTPRTPTISQNQPVYDECMQEALLRRVDPVEARHVCNVIVDGI